MGSLGNERAWEAIGAARVPTAPPQGLREGPYLKNVRDVRKFTRASPAVHPAELPVDGYQWRTEPVLRGNGVAP
jgi:hypothetical protein